MKSIYMFKMPFQTKLFNKNQKVWIRKLSGNLSAEVKGKFRGKGRYIIVWVKWKEEVSFEIKEIKVEDAFYEILMR